MGRKPIGERAMTDAERVRRWRDRHAERFAKRQPAQRVATMHDLIQSLPKEDDWDRWLGRKPWEEDEAGEERR